MTALIAWAAVLTWTTGWLVTARTLFRAWRPSRVPLCNNYTHVRGTDGGHKGQGHAKSCYRRRKPDLTRSDVDSDYEAAASAMCCAVFWFPVIAIALFIRHAPPELDAEKDARLGQLTRRNAELEAQLERDLP